MFVKNEVVRDNFWDVDDFFETRDKGFVAAVHTYQTKSGPVLVIFKDRKSYLMVEDGEVIGKERFKEILKELYDDGSLDEELDYLYGDDSISLVGKQGVIIDEDGNLDTLGFSEADRADIEDRMNDLDNYWVDEVQDMV